MNTFRVKINKIFAARVVTSDKHVQTIFKQVASSGDYVGFRNILSGFQKSRYVHAGSKQQIIKT